MASTKFALVLSPDPSTEDALMNQAGPERVIRHIDFSTYATGPSLAVVFEIFSEEITDFTDTVRGIGLKVGVYSTLEKAMSFSSRAFGLSEDGTLEEVNLDFGGGET